MVLGLFAQRRALNAAEQQVHVANLLEVPVFSIGCGSYLGEQGSHFLCIVVGPVGNVCLGKVVGTAPARTVTGEKVSIIVEERCTEVLLVVPERRNVSNGVLGVACEEVVTRAERHSSGQQKAGIFRANKPAVVGEPDMPHTIAEVAKEKGARLLRRGVDWQYEVQDKGWRFSDAQGVLENLPLPQVPQPNAATALAALRASGLAVSEQAIRDGIQNALLPGRFQIVSESPRLILDVAHNPHAAAYLAGRLKSLPKTGRVLAVIGMLHDKDIGGTLACMESVVDSWYCAPLEGPRGATAEQLMEHLGKGEIYSSVVSAWRAAMAEAKPEDTVLVCGSFHTVAHVMEVMDAGRTGGE